MVNFEQQFEEHVVKPFVDEYLAGRTPIPCTLCNNYIKFDRFLEMADSVGAHYMATGHYARVRFDPATGRYQLLRAVDDSKDQTYFLFGLTQAQFARTLFPLGELNKPEVRDIARSMDLAVASKGDSQEICFVPNGDYAAFMDAYLKEKGVAVERTSGEIVTTDGRTLGRHEGVHHFTVGQRKGLGIATGEALYVIATDPASQRVTVGGNDDLQCAQLRGQGGELDFHRRSRRRRHRAGRGEDPQQARRRPRHALRHGRCATRRGALRRPAARHHPGPGRCLLRRRYRARRRLDRIGFPSLDFWAYNTVRRLCMFAMLAVLVYLLAMGIPIYLLYRFHSQAWYWHTLVDPGGACDGVHPDTLCIPETAVRSALRFHLHLADDLGRGRPDSVPHAPPRKTRLRCRTVSARFRTK